MRKTVALIGLLAAFQANATNHESYYMTAFYNVPGSDSLFQGRYDDSILTAEVALSNGQDSIALRNNLCVAYTKLERLDKAITHCDAAVRLKKHSDRLNRGQCETLRAVAQANRGIVQAKLGNLTSARLDLAKVKSKHPGTTAIKRNMEKLERI